MSINNCHIQTVDCPQEGSVGAALKRKGVLIFDMKATAEATLFITHFLLLRVKDKFIYLMQPSLFIDAMDRPKEKIYPG